MRQDLSYLLEDCSRCMSKSLKMAICKAVLLPFGSLNTSAIILTPSRSLYVRHVRKKINHHALFIEPHLCVLLNSNLYIKQEATSPQTKNSAAVLSTPMSGFVCTAN